MPGRMSAMISSTARDLPAHRKEIGEACLRQGVFPVMMEHLPASDAEAVEVSLRMVDQSDVYLGVIAHRYGYVPSGQGLSITEMEYERAVQQRRPRLVFLMHDDHPVRASDVEKGRGAVQLEAFKDRLKTDRVAGFFKSPEDLRAQVVEALAQVRPRDLASFHRDASVPKPPEAYIAHPYTLLQTGSLVGRRDELALLDEWASRGDRAERIFSLVAVGGMGKSALTWGWFHDRAPQCLRPPAGRMWWSFYESDAGFENFVLSALAYATGQDRESLRELTPPERESRLLAVLDREPILIVLDGLERILNAYARMDAARLSDDDLDRTTANTGGARHQLRKTTDPRVGSFLRRLAQVRAARILISSRLAPADLQTETGRPLPCTTTHFLNGLADDDAVGLWHGLGGSGSRQTLLELFGRFDNYPLLIRALAGEVARWRRAPGDFDRWRIEHPDFNPTSLEPVQVKSHVLSFAFAGLDDSARKVLHAVAAFRMPATYDTLAVLLVGPKKAFQHERQLDETLTDLEDRGLLGWDRAANRYDLHPVVRGTAWDALDGSKKQGIWTDLRRHFEAVPTDRDWGRVSRVEDLSGTIELFHSLVGLGSAAEALVLARDRLYKPLFFRLGAMRPLAEMLEMLFVRDPNVASSMTVEHQGWGTTALAHAWKALGRPGEAAGLYRRAIRIYAGVDSPSVKAFARFMLALTLRYCGKLREAETLIRDVLMTNRLHGDRAEETDNLFHLGFSLAIRGGSIDDVRAAYERVFRTCETYGFTSLKSLARAAAAQSALWRGDHEEASTYAANLRVLASAVKTERDLIYAARLQGAAALHVGDLPTAEARLHEALTRARAIQYVEEELPALTNLAELRRRQGDLAAARTLLEDFWEPAERGPYPMFHADACNVLARIERDVGDRAAAAAAATRAYRLAWCDGPPFAYHWGLRDARTMLAALHAAEPADLPAHDESRHEPLPYIEIDPTNET